MLSSGRSVLLLQVKLDMQMSGAMKAEIRQNVIAALLVLLERAPLVHRNYILDDVKCAFHVF